MKPSKTRQPFCHSLNVWASRVMSLCPMQPFEIGIAHLMSFTQIAKGNAIVMFLLNLVVYLPAIHPANGDVYPSATEIGQQRMVAQWEQLHIVHLGCRVFLWLR